MFIRIGMTMTITELWTVSSEAGLELAVFDELIHIQVKMTGQNFLPRSAIVMGLHCG